MNERVVLRTMHERKWRIWRRLILVSVVSVIIIFLLIAQRDTQTRRRASQQLETIAAGLNADRERTGQWPDRFPTLAGWDPKRWLEYYFNAGYTRVAEAGGTTGVCAPRSSVALFLEADGRFIVLCDQHEFKAVWLTEEEFARDAERLGLGPARR